MECQSEVSSSSYNLMPQRKPHTEKETTGFFFSTEDVREFLFVLPKFLRSDVREIIGGKLCGEDPSRTSGVPKLKFHV